MLNYTYILIIGNLKDLVIFVALIQYQYINTRGVIDPSSTCRVLIENAALYLCATPSSGSSSRLCKAINLHCGQA